MAGMGKMTRRRSVKTFKLPRLTRGTYETRHCAIIANIVIRHKHTKRWWWGRERKKKKNSRPGSGLTCPRELITLMISIHSHDKNNDSAQQ